MNIINLTPHTINLLEKDNEIYLNRLNIPSSGIARVEEVVIDENSITIDEFKVPIYTKTFGTTAGLPDALDDVLYIVSSIVKFANSNRNDLIVPMDFVRDSKGNIIGCLGFSR